MVVLGYVFAIVIPFIGLILGIIAATRPHGRARRNGPWIIALSAVVFVAWVGLVVAAVHEHNHEEEQEFRNAVHKVTHAIETGGREFEHEVEQSGQKATRAIEKSERELEQAEHEAESKAR